MDIAACVPMHLTLHLSIDSMSNGISEGLFDLTANHNSRDFASDNREISQNDSDATLLFVKLPLP